MGMNKASIAYSEDDKEAVITFKHSRSDYVAILRLRFDDIGPDTGIQFENLSPRGLPCIPHELVIEACQTLWDRNGNVSAFYVREY